MNPLIKTSIRRPVTICVLVVVLMAAGVLATLNMSTNLLPNIKLPMLGISVVYPGASAQSVEQGVTAKVERALQTVPGITQLQTDSYDNVSVAVLTFDYGTDIDDKISAIEDAFESVALPDGCNEPSFIKIDMNGTATATIAVYNAAGDVDALTADANALAARLGGIEGVGSVNVLGTTERQIRITALRGLDVTSLLIVQALQNENLNIPLGSVMQEGTTVSIRNATDAASLLDVMRLPVQLPLGSQLIARLDGAKTMLRSAEECTLAQFEENITGQLYRLYVLLPMLDAQHTKTDEELAEMLVANPLVPASAKALLTPQLVHTVRAADFYLPADASEPQGPDNISPECTLGRLLAVKQAHVDDAGNPIYANGKPVVTDDAGRRVVSAGDKTLLVNGYGRLEIDGVLVDDNGTPLSLSDEQLAANYYSYGGYNVFEDAEALEMCNILGLGDGLGIALNTELVRFVRTCDFGGEQVPDENEAEGTATVYPEALLVPLASVGRAELCDSSVAYAEYNGLLAATVEVYAVSDANTTDVVNAVKAALERTELSGAALLLDDKAQFINDSISNVLTSIIIGGVLAVLVIYIFVRKIGSSLVVSVTMPLSVLVALTCLWAMGVSLNLVSLGGLAVGIGMLVDNSIVVLESITKRRDRGEDVYDACLNGTKEVAGSLLASTLTNVCVFFPILFARGLTREIFRDLVWAVLFSIVMSLIVAVTVIPSLYHLIYRRSPRKRYKRNPDGTFTKTTVDETQGHINNTNDKSAARRERFKQRLDRLRSRFGSASVSKLEKGYGRMLAKVLTKRVWVCVTALVLFAASVALVFTSGTEFLPEVDKGVIEVNVAFDTSASLDEAESTGKLIAQAIRDAYGDKLQYVSLTVGKQGLLATSNSGVIRIQTTKQLKTSETVQDIRSLVADLEGVNAKNVTVREMDGVVAEVTGGMASQSVTLLGDDMDTLRAAAAKVHEALLNADTEHIVSAVDNTPALNTEYSFTFDRLLCAQRGVDYQTAVLLLRVGLSGYTATNINVDGESLAVSVQTADDSKRDIDAVCDIIVGFDANGVIKLRDLLKRTPDGALYTADEVAASISKQDGRYTTSIDLEIYGTDSGSAGKTIAKTVREAIAGFDGVEYLEGGVMSYLNDAFDGLVVSLVAAFVLLYSVMACQFESLVKPFVVIMSIPFAFTGGFLALAITGMTLNVVSFVGLIMLMGVIVNGAIVMIDKINMLIAEGMTPQQAVVEGCRSRLRPILMTTLTTVLALVPLALGLGRGGELMQPMGITVLGGLLLGTAVTLVLIPCFYCIVKRIRFDKTAAEGPDQADEQADAESETDVESERPDAQSAATGEQADSESAATSESAETEENSSEAASRTDDGEADK